MKFSVELTYSEMIDDAKLDIVASQGVTEVSAPIEFVESVSKEKLKERSAAFKSRGIKITTAHPRFGLYNGANSFANQYTAQRGLYLEQLKDCFERMSILGAQLAPLHTNGVCLAEAPDWALELCAESISEVMPAAVDMGIILAVENTFFPSPQQWDGGAGALARPEGHSVLVYDNVDKLCRLIDQLASPNVKGCFDAGHAHYLGDLEKDHRRMGNRIALYHIHDNSRDRDTHLPPGYGTLNWESLGRLIPENKSEHVVYIEASPWMRGSYELMMREANALLSGGRRGESRRCLECGHLILTDDKGVFCGCGQ